MTLLTGDTDKMMHVADLSGSRLPDVRIAHNAASAAKYVARKRGVTAAVFSVPGFGRMVWSEDGWAVVSRAAVVEREDAAPPAV